jgi:hypothetical protein
VRLDHITPKAFYEKSQDEENIPSKHDNDTRWLQQTRFEQIPELKGGS